MSDPRTEGLAVVGMAGRFPGAPDLDAYWRLLRDGVEAITFYTPGELAAAGVPETLLANPRYVRAGAVLGRVDLFDAGFFGFTPREAELMDPQHRIFLECAWEALEHAGYDAARYDGSVGIFGGMGMSKYLLLNLLSRPEVVETAGALQLRLLNDKDFLVSTVAFKLDLTGPSIAVQSACSTSLVAVCVACQSLLNYQCDMALAGGITIALPQKTGYLAQDNFLSPDGHCRAFDAGAQGSVEGSGAGIVVLKRLSDAIADGDTIHAVITGYATNNDGSLKVGYTAPNPQAQAEVIAMAQAMSGARPDTVTYVEAHGTGTPLGDPIEVEALTQVFGAATERKGFCALGSVKTNIGHLDAAAGVAGLIKTVLAIRHGLLPPSLHYRSPNPQIDFAASPFFVNAEARPWRPEGGLPRRAGVSSFSMGGVNAHVVVEEPPAAEPAAPARPWDLLVLSARSETALAAATERLARHLEENPGLELADVAHTLQRGRRAFPHRRVVACRDTADAAAALRGLDPARVFTAAVTEPRARPVVFLFSGQGTQYPGMGRELYAEEPLFREEVDRCAALLQPRLGLDLRKVLHPTEETPEAAARLAQTALAQPALFTIEYALARLWMAWGIEPAAMLGHSIGEYVAACLAGAMTLEEALALVVERGRLMQELPAGAMLAVSLPEAEIVPWLAAELSLAAVNEPSRSVVSGLVPAIEDLERRLGERGVEHRRLVTSHAFHSAMMDPVLDRFRAAASRVRFQAPGIPWVSNLTGDWIRDGQAADPAYWAAHLRGTVRFADGLAAVLREGDPVLLEVGPGNTLSALARRQGRQALSSLRHARETGSDLGFLLAALGRLWLAGVEVEWPERHPGPRRRVPLPSYPFERQSYWIEARRSAPEGAARPAEEAPAPRHERPALATELVAPRSGLEERLAAMWQEVLGIARVGIHDNLFELGGHSLLGAQLLARIRAALGVDLPLDVFFEHPTIAGLAAAIESRGGVADEEPGIPRRAPGAGPAALSFAQERLWFIAQLDPDSPAYNVPAAVRLRGALDAPALERALGEAVRRHEILRATFATVDGRPVQEIGPLRPVPLPCVDLSGLPGERREPEARRLAAEDAHRPFDLRRGPLLRATLLRLAAVEHLALLAVHHLVSDAWSNALVVRDVVAAYAAFREGRPSPLAALPVQYAYFAEWQRRTLTDEALAPHLAWWRERLGGELPVLELPVDGPRPAAPGDRGGSCALVLPPELAQGLAALGRSEGATLFVVLLALFQTLLGRLSGQEDVIVGSPIAGREREELEEVAGLFLNVLAMRTDLGGDPTLRELLGRARATALAAHAHRELPFERLVEELRPRRDRGRHPIFDATLNLVNTPRTRPEVPGLEVRIEDPVDVAAQVALTLYAVESPAGIELRLVYKRDLFTPERAASLLDQVAWLAEQAVADPGRSIGSLSLVTPGARRILPDPSLPIEAPHHEPVPAQVAALATRTPEAPAVLQGERAWTYRELVEAARALAGLVAARTGRPRQVVAVSGPAPSFGLISSLLGVLWSGSVLLTLDPALPAARRRAMARRAGVRLLLHVDGAPPDAELRRLLPGVEMLHVDPETGLAEGEAGDWAAPGPDDPAYIFFTSGSTGVPKGVLGRHRGVSHFVDWQRERFEVGPGDRCAQLIGLAFDALLRDVFLPLTSGATLCLPEPADLPPPRRVEWLRRQGITVVHTLPAVAQSWLAGVEGTVPLPALRRVFFSGEPLTSALVERWRRTFPGAAMLVNLYGPTETTMVKCFHVVGDEPVPGVQPLGRPMPQTQALVLDAAGALCGVSEAGEIVLRTPFRTAGYINAPDENRARFVPNPLRDDPQDLLYRTGDRGRYRPDGSLELLGRLDEQIKVRGVRIEPAEVEAALAAHPAVREAAVALHDTGAGSRLIAWLVPEPGAEPAAPALRDFLRERLPEAMIPSAFVSLERLPLTPSGKVDRRALPAPGEGAVESEYAPPSGPVEEILAEIWAEVLQRERVGLDDDFFSLGGHSLIATQVVSRVEAAFGVAAPVRWLFERPTLRGLAARVAEALPRGARSTAPPIERVPRDGGLPLSFAQQRLWFLDRLEPGSAWYNLPAAMRLTGPLSVPALAASLAEIVRRHEALRTTFPEAGGQPAQCIATPGAGPLAVVDLSSLPAEARGTEAERLAREIAARPFDLARGPLLRTVLLRLEPEEHALALAVHHIVSDAWSIGVFIRELTALYGALRRREGSPLPELPVQYADFAAWQRRWLSGGEMERRVAAWRGLLAGMPGSLELPTDRPHPPVQTFRGGRIPFRLDAAATAALRAVARREGASLFMVLLAAFQALLHRYSGQEDLAVGSPVAGRTRRELEGLIGVFINTLVLRGDLSGEPSFRELLGRVRETAFRAFALQDVPFEKLVEELQPARDLARHPLFQVMLVLQNAPITGLDLADLSLVPIPVETGTAKFELLLWVSEQEGGLAGDLEHNADLFDRATAERLLGHLSALLASAAADPALPLPELELLSAEEQAQLVRWNETHADVGGEVPVHELVSRQAARTPDAVAVTSDAGALTYAELDRLSGRLAARLRGLGVGPDVPVAVALDRTPDLVAGVLAVLRSGGAYVPLDPAHPRERLAWILEDARPAVLLTHERLRQALPPCSAAIVAMDAEEGGTARAAPVQVWPESLAYVLYTSGSTGRPKGVQVTHRGLSNLVGSIRREPGFGAGDTFLAITTLAFDIGTLELLLPLTAGGRVALATREEAMDGFRLRVLLETSAVTVAQGTPATWRMLLDAGWEGMPGLKAFSGGEALAPELAERLRPRVGELWNLYGPTETTIYSTGHRVRPGEAPVAIGGPLANTRIHLAGRHLEPAPVGVPGEVLIGGEGLARGYLGRPDLTAERFVPDPFADAEPGARLYRTGDRARRRPDGEVEYLGRIDHQVKLRGYRVEPAEIEAALAAQPGVRESVVVARERNGDLRLVAYVVPADGELSFAELRRGLRERLPDYMVPAGWVALPALPLSENGKVDRRALPEPEDEAGSAFVAPRSELEETLAAIWREVLGRERIGVQDDFFLLGGHSLLATQVIARVRERFATDLSLPDLFREPTVERLALLVEAGRARPAARPLPAIRRAGRGTAHLGDLLTRLDTEEEGAA